MKKILLPILAVAVLAGCNKHEEHFVTATKTVEISITNGADATKAVTAPATTDQIVCAETDLTALFADASASISAEVTVTVGKWTLTETTIGFNTNK